VTAPANKVACPTCGCPVAWGPESPFRPFCSERCRLLDLGEWLTEGRAIPDPEPGPVPSGGTEDPPDPERGPGDPTG
jgi:uncharacterized protein